MRQRSNQPETPVSSPAAEGSPATAGTGHSAACAAPRDPDSSGRPTQRDPDPTECVVVAAPVLAFQCSECGDCCRGWSVPADRAFRHLLEDRLDRHAPERSIDAFVQPPVADSVQLQPVLRTRSGRCVFLSPQQQCSLHSHFGRGAKPLACQLFPYRQVVQPGVTSLSLDPACTMAAQMLATPFMPDTVEFRRDPKTIDLPSMRLIDGLDLETSLYHELESTLLALLALQHATVEERLLAGSLLVDIALDAFDSDDIPAAGARGWEQEKSFDHEDGLRDLLRRARAQTGNGLRQYFLLGRLVELVEQWLVAYQLEEGSRFWASTRRAMAVLDVDAETEGLSDRASRCIEVISDYWRQRRTAVDDVLANYVWQTLLARHLQAQYGLALGYRVLLVHYALVRLHAIAFATTDGVPPTPEHAVRAVQTVERNFGHLPLLRRFWKRTSITNLLLDAAFAPRLILLPDLELALDDEPPRRRANLSPGAEQAA